MLTHGYSEVIIIIFKMSNNTNENSNTRISAKSILNTLRYDCYLGLSTTTNKFIFKTNSKLNNKFIVNSAIT